MSIERVALGRITKKFHMTHSAIHVLLLFLLASVISACSPPEPTEPTAAPSNNAEVDIQTVQQLIQNIFDDIWSASATSDTAYVSRYHTDDFILLEHGEVWTGDTIRNWLLDRRANFDPAAPARKNSFDFYRSKHFGDRIWIAYQNYGDWVTAAGDTVASRGWLESAVAVRTPGGDWKLEMMHSTRNEPPH